MYTLWQAACRHQEQRLPQVSKPREMMPVGPHKSSNVHHSIGINGVIRGRTEEAEPLNGLVRSWLKQAIE